MRSFGKPLPTFPDHAVASADARMVVTMCGASNGWRCGTVHKTSSTWAAGPQLADRRAEAQKQHRTADKKYQQCNTPARIVDRGEKR